MALQPAACLMQVSALCQIQGSMLGWGRGLCSMDLLSDLPALPNQQIVQNDVLCIDRSVHAVPCVVPCLRSMSTTSGIALQEI